MIEWKRLFQDAVVDKSISTKVPTERINNPIQSIKIEETGELVR